jgi:hypothetical protein
MKPAATNMFAGFPQKDEPVLDAPLTVRLNLEKQPGDDLLEGPGASVEAGDLRIAPQRSCERQIIGSPRGEAHP